jgi:molybdopterin synthase catalytic subunit
MSQIIIAAQSIVTNSAHAPPANPTPPLLRCTVYHRLGIVPVGEASIVIAVSSPHRKEAFVACEYILEQVKLKVSVWKKEVYDTGETEWKENSV